MSTRVASLADPADTAFVVTPADGADMAAVARGLYVGGTGHVSVVTAGGDTVLFSAVPVGTILPIRCKRVRSTGTTATLIVALI